MAGVVVKFESVEAAQRYNEYAGVAEQHYANTIYFGIVTRNKVGGPQKFHKLHNVVGGHKTYLAVEDVVKLTRVA